MLDSNFLTGMIPTEIGMLSNLIELRLSHNTLKGTIPSEIGQITGLRGIHLSFNYLTQNIPIEFAMLSNLQNLQLKGNTLSGEAPLGVCKLREGNLNSFGGACRREFICNCCDRCSLGSYCSPAPCFVY
eukprot:scaffold137774_cov43-Attheya_sp.AAC.1